APRRRESLLLGAPPQDLAGRRAPARAHGLPRSLGRVARELIQSAANERLKRVRKLAGAKERDATGLFVAEGEDLVAAALDAGIRPVEAFVDAERPVLGARLPEATLVAPAVLAGVSSLAHPPRV